MGIPESGIWIVLCDDGASQGESPNWKLQIVIITCVKFVSQRRGGCQRIGG